MLCVNRGSQMAVIAKATQCDRQYGQLMSPCRNIQLRLKMYVRSGSNNDDFAMHNDIIPLAIPRYKSVMSNASQAKAEFSAAMPWR